MYKCINMINFKKKIVTFLHAFEHLAINPCSSKCEKRVKYLCMFVLLVHASNSVHNRTKLHRCALLRPHESPWAKLYHCGNASLFLIMTGMTRYAFTLLHDLLFLGQQPQRTGRPQPINPTAQLGLLLFFIGSIMGCKHLCLIFGCTPTVCSRVINGLLKVVVKKLKRHPLASIRFPNAEQLEYYAQLIHE
jgi:hypothetical protein